MGLQAPLLLCFSASHSYFSGSYHAHGLTAPQLAGRSSLIVVSSSQQLELSGSRFVLLLSLHFASEMYSYASHACTKWIRGVQLRMSRMYSFAEKVYKWRVLSM